MAQPPRLHQILLNWEQGVVYFVTVCVLGRKAVLANKAVFRATNEAVKQMRKWNVLAGIVMPDHIHFVVSPREDRGLPVSDFSTGFKPLLRRALPEQSWEWQNGCFDRLLRSDENLHYKWIYIEQNPVRAGLVRNVADWPYYLGSIAEQQTVGEAASFPIQSRGNLTGSPIEIEEGDGKLTASPTEDTSEKEEREASSLPYRKR